MFKPGDKVRAKGTALAEFHWENHPEIMEVLHVSDKPWGEYISIVGSPNNGKSDHDNTKNWVYNTYMFEMVESVDPIPAETIEHEGYIYTRGEKIAPSWVKKGVWAIHDDGDLAFVSEVLGNSVYYNLRTENNMSCKAELFEKAYRPFEEQDWKWGMYCEYQGEVWVVSYTPKKPESGGQPVCLGNGDNFTSTYLHEITPTFKR